MNPAVGNPVQEAREPELESCNLERVGRHLGASMLMVAWRRRECVDDQGSLSLSASFCTKTATLLSCRLFHIHLGKKQFDGAVVYT